jgi:hypothetical protein
MTKEKAREIIRPLRLEVSSGIANYLEEKIDQALIDAIQFAKDQSDQDHAMIESLLSQLTSVSDELADLKERHNDPDDD